MSRAVILSVLLATLIVVGTSTPVWAAQLDARINPNTETSPFKMTYLKTVFIEYPNVCVDWLSLLCNPTQLSYV